MAKGALSVEIALPFKFMETLLGKGRLVKAIALVYHRLEVDASPHHDSPRLLQVIHNILGKDVWAYHSLLPSSSRTGQWSPVYGEQNLQRVEADSCRS